MEDATPPVAPPEAPFTDLTGGAGAAPVKVCPTCGREYPDAFRFCREDATPLRAAPGLPGAQGDLPHRAAPRPPLRRSLVPYGAGVVALFLVGAGGLVWFLRARTAPNRAGSGGGAAAPATVPRTEVAPAGTMRTIADLDVALEVPPGWEGGTVEKHDGYQRVRFSPPGKPWVSVLVDWDTDRKGVPADAVWRDLDRRFTRTYGARYTRLAWQEGRLGNRAAAVWHFEIQKNNEPRLRKWDTGITVSNGTGYALLCAAPTAEFTAWQPTFERVVASFEPPDEGDD